MRDGKVCLIVKSLLLAVFITALSFFLNGFEYVLLLLAAAAIHEIGHLLAASLLGVGLVRWDKNFLHLSYKFDFSSSSYLSEIVVSLAGAGFNLLFAFLTIVVFDRFSYLTLFFIFSNLSLALFNLMPISVLDGAGALCALLSIPFGCDAAERITNGVSFVFSAAFFVLAIYIQLRVGANFTLMFTALLMLCNCINKRGRFLYDS